MRQIRGPGGTVGKTSKLKARLTSPADRSGYARLKGTRTGVVAFYRKVFRIAHHLDDIQ